MIFAKRLDSIATARWLGIGWLSLTAGCTSPPSVAPLLAIADRALEQEIALVQGDTQRQARAHQQTRQMLASAYAADLQTKSAELNATWVQEATDVYVAACEELARRQLLDEKAQENRLDNLHLARQVQQRALQVIQVQDQTITSILGLDLWRLDRKLTATNTSNSRETSP